MQSVLSRAARLRAAMTLVELLVVVAIIGALAAMLLPAIQTARESARRAQCQNNLREIGVALDLHASQNRAFPIGCIGCKGTPSPEGTPPPPLRYISWNVQILPFLEERSLWERFDFELPSHQPSNKAVGANVVSVFLCPSTELEETHSRKGAWKDTAFTDYGGIYGIEGPGHDLDPSDANNSQWLRRESLGAMLYEVLVRPRQITDGLSKTVSIAEMSARRLSQETEWVNGHNVFAQEASTPINGALVQVNEIGSPHSGGAQMAFCDGHVTFVEEGIEQIVLNAMLTKEGGEK